jgi:hypothetical protein
MEPVSAVEIVPGKKYLLIIKDKLDGQMRDAFREAAPTYESYLKERGIDLTIILNAYESDLYELSAMTCGGVIPAGEPIRLSGCGCTVPESVLQGVSNPPTLIHTNAVSGAPPARGVR